MKHFSLAICLLTCLMCIFASSALADGDSTGYAFGFSTQCVSETGGYAHAPEGQLHEKKGTCEIIEVRHSVIGNGSNLQYTNYIAAYIPSEGMYAGHKWQKPDMIYHSCTSPYIERYCWVVPGGRGNTKYSSNGHLTTIRIEGQFRPH